MRVTVCCCLLMALFVLRCGLGWFCPAISAVLVSSLPFDGRLCCWARCVAQQLVLGGRVSAASLSCLGVQPSCGVCRCARRGQVDICVGGSRLLSSCGGTWGHACACSCWC